MPQTGGFGRCPPFRFERRVFRLTRKTQVSNAFQENASVGIYYAAQILMFDLAPRSRLTSSVQFVFDTVFRRSSERAAPRISIVAAKPLRFGTFQLSITSNETGKAVLETSTDLVAWEPVKDLILKNEFRIEESQAAEEDTGYCRLRSGDTVSEAFGFYKMQAAPGYSLLGYPFLPLGQSLQDLLHWLPTGTEITRFDPIMMKLRKSAYLGPSKWVDPEPLKNGEGFLVFNPASTVFPIVVSGIVPQGAQRKALQAGTSLRSSMLPLSGDIEKDLCVPFGSGETLTLFYSDRQEYVDFERTAEGWSEHPPKIRIGEGFWIGKKEASQWNQSLPAAASDSHELSV